MPKRPIEPTNPTLRCVLGGYGTPPKQLYATILPTNNSVAALKLLAITNENRQRRKSQADNATDALCVFLEQLADEIFGFGGDLGKRVGVERPLAFADSLQGVASGRLAVERRQTTQPTAHLNYCTGVHRYWVYYYSLLRQRAAHTYHIQ